MFISVVTLPHSFPNQRFRLSHPFHVQAQAQAATAEREGASSLRRIAQLEAQLSYVQAQQARSAEAEAATAAEHKCTLTELLAARSIQAMHSEAHQREVTNLQVCVF